jgi:hypothetical protein
MLFVEGKLFSLARNEQKIIFIPACINSLA